MQPAEVRLLLQPYVLAYAVAFAGVRHREIGGVVDLDDLKQFARIRALNALERLDVTTSTESQLAYFRTVVSSALSDACREHDPLGRRGRSRRSAFLLAVETATQNLRRSLTMAELDTIAQEIIGDGAGYEAFYRCRYGENPALGDGERSHDDYSEQETAAIYKELQAAIAAHPDRDVREFLHWALTGEVPKQHRNKLVVTRPKQLVERLGPRLLELLEIESTGIAS
jgi:DNA-directed RNA polymerase specialized sigma subunit